MAVGEDGVRNDPINETSIENGAAAEVEAASTSSSTGNSSSGFVSGVLPGVREASRKLQLKMKFGTLSSPKRTGESSFGNCMVVRYCLFQFNLHELYKLF